ncbi:MAG: hypothetical protein RM338_30155 [Nostoc sp. DedQUE12a]|nr:hypothetical protein [Nostoc sp. DedQUE12a]
MLANAPENLSISQMSTLFAQAAEVEFVAPAFENKDKVMFNDSHIGLTQKLKQRPAIRFRCVGGSVKIDM